MYYVYTHYTRIILSVLFCIFSILGVVSCVYIAIIVTIKYVLLHNSEGYFSCARPQHLHRSVSYTVAINDPYTRVVIIQ